MRRMAALRMNMLAQSYLEFASFIPAVLTCFIQCKAAVIINRLSPVPAPPICLT